ncbi:MAG: dTDP-4-dehydrorhamnose 3,5-epimerase [Nanopusillaceae archaeon]
MDAEVRETSIPGCFEIIPKVFRDERGIFVKTFSYSFFKKYGLNTDFKEQFFSISRKDVVRGLHFQLPPMDHDKLVYCIYGEAFDVVVDLRVGSPTYGKYQTFILSGEKSNMLYIPKGLAHGFCALSDKVIMLYAVSVEYSPEHDSGILWNSMDIPWPCKNVIISEKDSKLTPFDKFKSPFIYNRGDNNE